jgi:hypothetical protein
MLHVVPSAEILLSENFMLRMGLQLPPPPGNGVARKAGRHRPQLRRGLEGEQVST